MTFVSTIDGEVRIRSEREPCAYLPSQSSTIEYRFVPDLTDEQFAGLLCRGWRRMGSSLHRPVCSACQACQCVRIDVREFQPTRSQRRNLKRNQHVRLKVRQPGLSLELLDLYDRYHRDMQQRRNWGYEPITAMEYAGSFLAGPVRFLREFQYYADQELVGVGLVDQIAESISSVYFFHAPEWRSRGLGTYSILKEVEYARSQGFKYNYLGFWISDCVSMSYKSRFRPQQRLERFVDDHEAPSWVPHAP